jgi:hypothetical protein
MRKKDLKQIFVPTNEIVYVVGDAGISTRRFVGGKLVPLLIIDTEGHPGIAEFINVQQHLPPGDVACTWGRPQDSREHIFLHLKLSRPLQTSVFIMFNVARQGILVESILNAQCMYIQSGKEGDRLKHDLSVPKIFVEVPYTRFKPVWDNLYLDSVVTRMRKSGLGRQQAKRAAKKFIDEIRAFITIRMGN